MCLQCAKMIAEKHFSSIHKSHVALQYNIKSDSSFAKELAQSTNKNLSQKQPEGKLRL